MCICVDSIPAKQNMADKSKDDAEPLRVIFSGESGAEASSSTAHDNSGDVLHDKKCTFRPPPRGLTPNEYILCHR